MARELAGKRIAVVAPVTTRKPGDRPTFCATMIAAFREGRLAAAP